MRTRYAARFRGGLSLCILCLALSSVSIHAQSPGSETAAGELSDLSLEIFPAIDADDASAGASANALSPVIDQSVWNQASVSGFSVRKSASWSELGLDPGEDPTGLALDTATRDGALAAMLIVYFHDGKRLTLIAKVYETGRRKLIAGATASGADDLGLLNTVAGLSTEMLQRLSAQAQDLVARANNKTDPGLSRGLEIKSPDDGAVVSLANSGALGTISGGVLDLSFRPLATGQPIAFGVSKPGYYDSTQTLTLHDENPVVSLKSLYPKSFWTLLVGVDPGLISLQEGSRAPLQFSLAAGLRGFIIPDTLMVQGWYTADITASPSAAISSSAPAANGLSVPGIFLNVISADIAVAPFFPPQSVFRFFIGLGLGTYLSSPNWSDTVYVDPFIEIPYFSLQANLHPFIIEIESAARFTVPVGDNLMTPGLVRSFGPIRFTVGYKW